MMIATSSIAPATLPSEASPAGSLNAGALNAGYGVSLSDSAAFEHALAHSQGGVVTVQGQLTPGPGQAMQALFKPLDHISTEAGELSSMAKAATDGTRPMSPGEMVSLTVKCHELMFHCQLTANVANRTSDGLQQLFRQQS